MHTARLRDARLQGALGSRLIAGAAGYGMDIKQALFQHEVGRSWVSGGVAQAEVEQITTLSKSSMTRLKEGVAREMASTDHEESRAWRR